MRVAFPGLRALHCSFILVEPDLFLSPAKRFSNHNVFMNMPERLPYPVHHVGQQDHVDVMRWIMADDSADAGVEAIFLIVEQLPGLV